MILRAVVAAIGLLLAGAAQACQMPVLDWAGRDLVDGETRFGIAWRLVPAQPKVGEFFAVEFAVCVGGPPLPAELFRVDAIMPAHKHGMNFQPKIVMIGPSIYRAEGMMFHMPGTWQLSFERRDPSGASRLATDIEIE